MDRITAIKRELETIESVNSCSYNNDGLYNEMRILKGKLEKELAELVGENDGSKKDR